MSLQPDQQPQHPSSQPRIMIGYAAISIALALLLYQLLSSVVMAFSQSGWLGFRSLAAAVFPLSIATYLGHIAHLQLPIRKSKSPLINSFIIFMLWTLLLFGIDGINQFPRFPLEELLYSITLSVMIWRYRYHDSSRVLLACCYGIISGSLAAVIIFGVNPIFL